MTKYECIDFLIKNNIQCHKMNCDYCYFKMHYIHNENTQFPTECYMNRFNNYIQRKNMHEKLNIKNMFDFLLQYKLKKIKQILKT